MTLGAILLLFLLLTLLNLPIAVVLALCSGLYFVSAGIPPQMVAQRMLAATQSFPLLAVPLFILSGSLMNASGMTRHLFALARRLVGRLPGALGHIVVVTGMIMAGTSGSAIADTAAITQVAVPEMEKAGYPRAFAASISAFAGTIGPIIPPSIMFVIYGWLADVSVGKLFLGGAIPGILLGFFLMVAISITAVRRHFGRVAKEAEVAPALEGKEGGLAKGVVAALMPLLVLGGIVAGIFTPTEAAAVAVAYALVVGVFVYRSLSWRSLLEATRESVLSTAAIMFVVAASYAFGYALILSEAPATLLDVFTSITQNRLVFLAMVNLALLILGCFMESTAIMLITVPLLLPLLETFQVDPVHFGVMMTVNLLIGTITPPFGVLMFTACGIAHCSTYEFQRESLPFYAAMLVALIVVTYWPNLTLWLPRILGG